MTPRTFERITTTRIEAVQYDGTEDSRHAIRVLGANSSVDRAGNLRLVVGKDGAQGSVKVPVGHWVAKADDHFYPIDPDVFDKTYRPVES